VNLHAIANKAISRINPNEPCLIFKAKGGTNVKGKVGSAYEPGVSAMLQLQSEGGDEMAEDKAWSIEVSRKAWISKGLDPLSRVEATGGDIVRRADGTYWLVTALLEDFSAWSGVRMVLQVQEPNVEAGGD
jgi:hypothetical protein